MTQLQHNKIYQGDVLEVLKTFPSESVDCIVTSPPYYGLCDYVVDGQIGLEGSMTEFLDRLFNITAELHRVLKKSGTLFWNHGDSYAGSGKGYGDKSPDPKYKSLLRGGGGPRSRTIKPEKSNIPSKSLMLQAHRLAIRMVDEQGWILRNQLIWHKPNAMPASVKDRFTVDYEPVFFFSKSQDYSFEPQYEPVSPDFKRRIKTGWKGNEKRGDPSGVSNHLSRYFGSDEAIRKAERGRNKRSVWSVPTKAFKGAHYATFPEKLITPMISAGCPKGGVVLDPFMGAGTTGLVARSLGRDFVGIDLNPEYIKMAEARIWNRIL